MFCHFSAYVELGGNNWLELEMVGIFASDWTSLDHWVHPHQEWEQRELRAVGTQFLCVSWTRCVDMATLAPETPTWHDVMDVMATHWLMVKPMYE